MEKATVCYAAHCSLDGNLILSALGSPSLDHILTCDAVFEHTYLCLILSNYLSIMDVENLNKTSKALPHFHRILLRAEPNIVCNLFQYDPACAHQLSMPIECRLKFLFLVVMRTLYVPSIVNSLIGNCTASCRDPEKSLGSEQKLYSRNYSPN